MHIEMCRSFASLQIDSFHNITVAIDLQEHAVLRQNEDSGLLHRLNQLSTVSVTLCKQLRGDGIVGVYYVNLCKCIYEQVVPINAWKHLTLPQRGFWKGDS